MRKLGCWGSVAVALLMGAGTAHADPFTVTSSPPSSLRGVDNAWFNNLIKLNGPPTATTKTYVANSIILFGGDLVAVPNATITIMSQGGAQAGFAGILFAGSVDTMSWATTNHPAPPANSSPKHASNSIHSSSSTSVPGAGAAYDPLRSDYSGLGVSVSLGNAVVQGQLALNALPPWAGVPGLGASAFVNPNLGVALSTPAAAAGLANSAAIDPPATPEPSALWLLAGGLAFAMVLKRYNLGLNRG